MTRRGELLASTKSAAKSALGVCVLTGAALLLNEAALRLDEPVPETQDQDEHDNNQRIAVGTFTAVGGLLVVMARSDQRKIREANEALERTESEPVSS